MKEIALYEAKNLLSALVQQVEETGEDILITRHGKPAARLAPIEAPVAQTQSEAVRRLLALRDEIARRNPDAERVPWETVKRWMRDEDDGEE